MIWSSIQQPRPPLSSTHIHPCALCTTVENYIHCSAMEVHPPPRTLTADIALYYTALPTGQSNRVNQCNSSKSGRGDWRHFQIPKNCAKSLLEPVLPLLLCTAQKSSLKPRWNSAVSLLRTSVFFSTEPPTPGPYGAAVILAGQSSVQTIDKVLFKQFLWVLPASVEGTCLEQDLSVNVRGM